MRSRLGSLAAAAIAAVVLLLLMVVACGDPEPSGPAGAHVRTRVVETGRMALDGIYPSMTGPYQRVAVGATDLDWITGFSTQIIDDATEEELGGEFFCHSQIQVGPGLRLAVEATGTQQMQLPPGFGIPAASILAEMKADWPSLIMQGMLLNNFAADIDRQVRVRTSIDYLTDEDVGPESLKRLYPTHAVMIVRDLKQYAPPEGYPVNDDVTTHCNLVGEAPDHWYVPPGPQTTRLRGKLNIPVPARVHYIVTHMHNHGEYVRLTDTVTREVLWQADVEYEPQRRQIASIPVYSSAQGFEVHPDRDYELEVRYDNTTDRDTDAMAAMYMYYNPNGNRELSATEGYWLSGSSMRQIRTR